MMPKSNPRSVTYHITTRWNERCGSCRGPCATITTWREGIGPDDPMEVFSEYVHLVDDVALDVLEAAGLEVNGMRRELQLHLGYPLPLAW